MFVNGTQGNISMGHSSELSAIGIITPGRTFARAAELGHLLSTATQATLPSIEVNDHPTLKTSTIPVMLPLKEYPAVEETLRVLLEAKANLAALTSRSEERRVGKECRVR